jgi:hypothetical protein
MLQTEKRYFLKNSNLLEEIHKSKLTYCCYSNSLYGNYDIICGDYELVTPNVISEFFISHPDKSEIIIRVMTNEHVLEHCKDGKVNLQYLKLTPFKHFLLTKKDFDDCFDSFGASIIEIDTLNKKIQLLKEQIKDNNKNIRFNKLNKELQEPYKKFNSECKKEIQDLISRIKVISREFSTNIKTYMVEVLRSHWSGDTIETGQFNIDKGKLTNTLVKMLMLFVDQYARAGNWSGYTYIEDMKSSALCHLIDVALKFEELKSNNAFSYLTQVAAMKFTATLNSEKIQRRIKSKMMQDIGYNPTYGEMADLEYNQSKEDWENNSMQDESEETCY